MGKARVRSHDFDVVGVVDVVCPKEPFTVRSQWVNAIAMAIFTAARKIAATMGGEQTGITVMDLSSPALFCQLRAMIPRVISGSRDLGLKPG